MFRSVLFIALMSGAALAQQMALPGGANSLRETFEDWQVTCVTHGSTKRCALSQEQFDLKRQRILAIEFMPGDVNALSGTLILPFGLLVEPGIAMQIDDKPFG